MNVKWMYVCLKKMKKKKKSGILPPNLNILVKGIDQLETITTIFGNSIVNGMNTEQLEIITTICE